jgi:hypothetical protein
LVTGIARRRAAARLGPVQATECLTQNAGLSRTWREQGERRERRITARADVNRMLAEAAERNAVAAVRRERREGREVIDRLKARSRGVAIRGGPVGEAACQACRDLGATAAESAVICRRNSGGAW